MKRLLIIFSVVLSALFCITQVNAQTTKPTKKELKAQEVKNLVESKNFVFKATFMYPMGGGQRYLDRIYDLTIAPDTVTSFLPFFGVAYMNTGYTPNDDGGIKFTSTKFDYKVDNLKKGGYRIFIKPNDITNRTQMYLEVYPTGYANLSVVSVNKQSIRYDGIVAERPKPKS
ncbi:DUF4251 domain-containing protein [Mucilaginibacter achroorhodeus]|uniref:DUF4251 domain-containing protein n=1 Tax=Mucilaginibacter achroorhodeus TaxID=2599294 RepID=A0A563U3W6_9SPHI|nr:MULTISPECIES: DUF4251 domain-containing protein [Mucilaginibacter]QXV64466.1 DUF4251 domain-containing protein [Mucilaginibacter sp. 21P]TWR26047.1 DUF4251 domain-containing protein [Mucilaginibacter achroorhodeus]